MQHLIWCQHVDATIGVNKMSRGQKYDHQLQASAAWKVANASMGAPASNSRLKRFINSGAHMQVLS